MPIKNTLGMPVERDEVKEVTEVTGDLKVVLSSEESDDVVLADDGFVPEVSRDCVEEIDLGLDVVLDGESEDDDSDEVVAVGDTEQSLLDLLDELDDDESAEDVVSGDEDLLIDDEVDRTEGDDKNELLDILDGLDDSESTEDVDVVEGNESNEKTDLLDLLDGSESTEDFNVVERNESNEKTDLLDILDGLDDSESSQVETVNNDTESLLDLLDGLDNSKTSDDVKTLNAADSLLDFLDAEDSTSEYSEETESDSLENLLSGLKGGIPNISIPVTKEKAKEAPESSVYDWFSVGAKSVVDDSGIVHSYGVASDSNKNKKGMEDTNVICCPLVGSTALFCVFDGHSGADCAKKLASIFPGIVRKCIKNVPEYAYDMSFWISVYEHTDEALLQYEYQGSTGTTMLVWEKNGKRYLQCSNIGDSEGYLRQNDSITPITEDHKLDNPEERDRILGMGIELEDKQTRISGLSVTRSFGDHFAKEIESGMIAVPFVSQTYEVFENDIVILASDGLWDSFDAISAFAQVTSEPQVVANRLTSKAKEGTTDNITTVVIQF